MKYSIALPNGWKMSLVDIKDPVEAEELRLHERIGIWNDR